MNTDVVEFDHGRASSRKPWCSTRRKACFDRINRMNGIV
jgi:hypothetical protein